VAVTSIPWIDNKYVRQPRPFSVTWRHRTRDIRFAIGHFLLVVLWNWASIYIGFWRYWSLSILQYPSRKKRYIFRGGPDLRKWRRAPDGCVTPLARGSTLPMFCNSGDIHWHSSVQTKSYLLTVNKLQRTNCRVSYTEYDKLVHISQWGGLGRQAPQLCSLPTQKNLTPSVTTPEVCYCWSTSEPQ